MAPAPLRRSATTDAQPRLCILGAEPIRFKVGSRRTCKLHHLAAVHDSKVDTKSECAPAFDNVGVACTRQGAGLGRLQVWGCQSVLWCCRWLQLLVGIQTMAEVGDPCAFAQSEPKHQGLERELSPIRNIRQPSIKALSPRHFFTNDLL